VDVASILVDCPDHCQGFELGGGVGGLGVLELETSIGNSSFLAILLYLREYSSEAKC